jgi:tetratricopeptide (TPR) repeat protein
LITVFDIILAPGELPNNALEERLGRHAYNPERGNAYDSSSLENMQEMRKDSKSRIKSIIAFAVIAVIVVGVIVYFVWPRTPLLSGNTTDDNGELTVTQITNLYNEGKFGLAAPALSKYLASNPNDITMRDMLASSYLLIGKNKEAISEYKTLLKTKPDDADILYKIGVTLQRMGRRHEAIVYLSRASTASPKTILFRIELARANTKAKLYNNAIEEWKSILDLLPENDQTRVNIIAELANIYLIQANFNEAQKVLEQGLAIDPENTTLKALELKSGRTLLDSENSDNG